MAVLIAPLVTITASSKTRTGNLTVPGLNCTVTLGMGGVCDERDKIEGDGKTPLGNYRFLTVYYRPDRINAPHTRLPLIGLNPLMGWCDDPLHPAYNQAIEKPFSGSHESLWRDDHLYDLIVTLSHNTAPAVPGKGSAIFCHIMAEEEKPTKGCIGLKRPNLISLLRLLGPNSMIKITTAD